MARLTIFTILILALTSCATSGQVGLIDFNDKYNQSVPTNPKYKIETVGINRYQIVVYQGSALISERTTRVSFLNKAALITMEDHCINYNGILGEYNIKDSVDSMGYINVIGYFVCNIPPIKDKAPVPKFKKL